jgi:hypothetical protein
MIKSKPAIQRWLANISRDVDFEEFRGGMASTGFGFCLAHGTTGRIVGIKLSFKSNKRRIMWKEANDVHVQEAVERQKAFESNNGK